MICHSLRKHRERIENLKRNGHLKGIVYLEDEAEKPVRFLERSIIQHNAPFTGQHLTLTDFQKDDILRPLYGFKWAETGNRVFNDGLILIPKKSGKTTIVAGILLYELFLGAPGQNIYVASTSKGLLDKSSWDDVTKFIQASPNLLKRATPWGKKVITKWIGNETKSYIQPLANTLSQDGLRPSVILIDELHKFTLQDKTFYQMLVQSSKYNPNRLVLRITTAGQDTNSILYNEYEYAKKILDGIALNSDFYFPVILEPDEGDKWDDVSTLEKVHPSLDVTIPKQQLIDTLNQAKEMPDIRNEYKQLYLNLWTTDTTLKFIDYSKWESCQQEYTEDDLAGRECFLTFDLANTTDLCALTAIFPPTETDQRIKTLAWSYMPQSQMYERRNEAPFMLWAEQGFITATTGEFENVIDHDAIYNKIMELNDLFTVKAIGYDQRFASQMLHKLAREGFELIDIAQGYKEISAATKQFRDWIYQGKFSHNGNPCLSWQVGNAKIREIEGGLIKIMKFYKSEKFRVDAAVSLVMGVHMILNSQNQDNEIRDYKPGEGIFSL